MRKIGRFILFIAGICIAMFLILFVIIWINSPGKLKPLTDDSGQVITGALAEKEWLNIGGIKQGFFIRGENPDNPVILYLHGGPGSPELPLTEAAENGDRLEKYFTVCYWDQRGAGMTYHKDTDPASMNVPQYVEDTREITEYLLSRFGKERIYLMGHSWGSYLGVKVIEKYPEYYYAYMGIGQVTHQHLSEQLAYHYMMDRAQEAGDKKVIKDLKRFDPEADGFPTNEYLLEVRMLYMNKYGIGITHRPYSMVSLLNDILMFRGYTLSEKMGYAKGSLFSLENTFPYVIDDNLFESSASFDIPVFVIHGFYDYQVSYALAKEWIKKIKAPDKKLFTFEHSAHSPNIEEQEKFVSIVREIADRYNSTIGVKMEILPHVFDSIPEKIVYRITNFTGHTIEFGANYEIDRQIDGEWRKLSFTDNMAFISIMYMMEPGKYADYDVYMYKDEIDYPAGKYRLRKQYFSEGENKEISAEFMIR